ncbi:hypothetical protein [Exiguobacterium sp. AT1b]|uniref:Cytoplasmic protein n=1 Tax=Exiguobacterium sp. (strain ATCC BAA-1283 / AT1b) TaxID=360911 RepID=C4L6S1_EXISA|nr:hypothetical protein [Exiguobacterium sp. AT1b]ACQ71950.1 putative cytoplasmic protein [Exiguobacterium sp. AT1b]
MSNLKDRLEQAKTNVRNAENAKTIAETQKASAEQQLEEVIAKMAEEGVTPETISEEIVKLETKISEDLGKVERLIPQDV